MKYQLLHHSEWDGIYASYFDTLEEVKKFIEENYDYTLRLFEKQEATKVASIKEEAFKQRQVKADAPVINEKVERKSSNSNIYVNELSKYR